jgi:hypothetical protein
LAQATPGAEHAVADASPLAYVAKRASFSGEGNVIVVESELNDAAIAWITDQLLKRARLSVK